MCPTSQELENAKRYSWMRPPACDLVSSGTLVLTIENFRGARRTRASRVVASRRRSVRYTPLAPPSRLTPDEAAVLLRIPRRALRAEPEWFAPGLGETTGQPRLATLEGVIALMKTRRGRPDSATTTLLRGVL